MNGNTIISNRISKIATQSINLLLVLCLFSLVGCSTSAKDESLKDTSMRVVSLDADGGAWVECGSNSDLEKFQRGNVLIVTESGTNRTKAFLMVKSVRYPAQDNNWAMVQALQNRKGESGLDCQIVNPEGETYKPVPQDIAIEKNQERLDYIKSITHLPNDETVSVGDQVEYHSKKFDREDFELWF